MQSVGIETLRQANRALGASLNRLRSFRKVAASAIPQEEFSTLRKEVGRATAAMRNIIPNGYENGDLEKAIAEYQDVVRQLAKLLPLIYGALLAHKEKLKAALDHVQRVEAWAETNRGSL